MVSDSLARKGASTSDLWRAKPISKLTAEEQRRLDRQRANKRKWAQKERERSKREMESLTHTNGYLELKKEALRRHVDNLQKYEFSLRTALIDHYCEMSVKTPQVAGATSKQDVVRIKITPTIEGRGSGSRLVRQEETITADGFTRLTSGVESTQALTSEVESIKASTKQKGKKLKTKMRSGWKKIEGLCFSSQSNVVDSQEKDSFWPCPDSSVDITTILEATPTIYTAVTVPPQPSPRGQQHISECVGLLGITDREKVSQGEDESFTQQHIPEIGGCDTGQKTLQSLGFNMNEVDENPLSFLRLLHADETPIDDLQWHPNTTIFSMPVAQKDLIEIGLEEPNATGNTIFTPETDTQYNFSENNFELESEPTDIELIDVESLLVDGEIEYLSSCSNGVSNEFDNSDGNYFMYDHIGSGTTAEIQTTDFILNGTCFTGKHTDRPATSHKVSVDYQNTGKVISFQKLRTSSMVTSDTTNQFSESGVSSAAAKPISDVGVLVVNQGKEFSHITTPGISLLTTVSNFPTSVASSQCQDVSSDITFSSKTLISSISSQNRHSKANTLWIKAGTDSSSASTLTSKNRPAHYKRSSSFHGDCAKIDKPKKCARSLSFPRSLSGGTVYDLGETNVMNVITDSLSRDVQAV